ncbi:MAG: hypothetical protein KDI32_01120 [Pseudomonadales bacterium]|nr:hypothetical protein [Pseudomonadales bacterium]
MKPRTRPRSTAALEAALDAATRDALVEIARLLVSAGYGFGAFERHAKHAFVAAAKEVLLRQGARVNRSMIAASTGLTRAEVGELLRTDSLANHSPRHASRAARLALAWRTKKPFAGHSLVLKTTPRQVANATKGPLFDELVRRHGGDIPPRAMQAELLRSGLAEKSADGRLRLSNANRDSLLRAVQAVETTLPWLRAVAPQVIDPHPGEPITSTKSVTALGFTTERALFSALGRILDRTSTLLDGFDKIAGGKRAPGELIVGVAVAGSSPPKLRKTRPASS